MFNKNCSKYVIPSEYLAIDEATKGVKVGATKAVKDDLIKSKM